MRRTNDLVSNSTNTRLNAYTIRFRILIDPSKYRIHDLTMTYDGRVAGYAEDQAKTVEEDGWNAKWLRIYSHAGTHMDAPIHFNVNNKTIDQFEPIESMGPAWMVHIDIKSERQLITLQDIEQIVAKFKAGDSILLHTNWSDYVGEEKYKDELPRISRELARWCVDRQVRVLGVEAPSVADVNNLKEVTEIHEILLGGGVIIVEGLCNLDQIKSEKVFLMAMPIKTKFGDGAPARVLAFEEHK